MGFMNIYIALHANLLTMKGDFTGDDFWIASFVLMWNKFAGVVFTNGIHSLNGNNNPDTGCREA